MIPGLVDRIKRLSMKILEKHKEDFGANFLENKKTLDEISIIRSKGLKNEIAGFITKTIKHEITDKKIKEEQIAKQAQFDTEITENLESHSTDSIKTTTESEPFSTESVSQKKSE